MKSLLLLDERALLFYKNEKILYALIAGFFITLYLPFIHVLNNVFIGLIVVYTFFFNSIHDKLVLFKQRDEILCMLLFFGLHVISVLLSKNKEEAWSIIALRSPLLLFPLSLGSIYITGQLKKRILYLFVIVTSGVAMICLLYALRQYILTHDISVLCSDGLSNAIGKQSSYLAIIFTIAIFCIVYLFYAVAPFVNGRLLKGCLVILFLTHYMLASRIALVILYAFVFVLIGYIHFYKKHSLIKGISYIAGFVLLVLSLNKLLPFTSNRLEEVKYTNYSFASTAPESNYKSETTPDQWNGGNIRWAVWNCGWELARQNLLLGTQTGDKMDKLMRVYAANNFKFAHETRRNLHNNYLDALVTFGIPGLILFLLSYIVLPLQRAVKNKDGLSFCIITAFALGLFFEVYFDRSLGCVFILFFMSLLAAFTPLQKRVPELKPDCGYLAVLSEGEEIVNF